MCYVVLPKYMTSLGYASFFESDGIQDVVFPSSVVEIESDAFYSATTLTQVNMPQSLKKVGSDSFSKTGLTTVSLPASLDSIYGRAFRGTPITTIDLKDVKYIGHDCFAGCRLEGMLNVSSLQIIPEGAFSGNTISSITFGKQLKEIEKEAFYSNKMLTTVTLPKGLEIIGEKAFSDCTNLANIEFPNTIQSIGYQAFYCTAWNDNLKGENGVVYVGNLAYAFDNNSLENPELLTFLEGTIGICSNFKVASNAETIKKIVFPTSLKRIDGSKNRTGCFSSLSTLEEVVLNEGLEYIGYSAFANSEKMWIEKLPESLKYIGIYAFEGCDGLTEITISDKIEFLGYRAFADCKGLVTIRYNSNMDYSDVDEKDWVYSQKGNVFRDCEGIYNIIIGENVNYIPESMFESTGVHKVTFENADARTEKLALGENCFNSCSNLLEITLPSMYSIGKDCFYNSGLTSLTVNGDCDYIEGGSRGMNLGRNIESVRIAGRICKIGDSVFDGYNGGSAIHTFEALSCDSIGSYAFAQSNIKNFVINAGGTTIGDNAFYLCNLLESISINDNSVLGVSSFIYCSSLREVNLGKGILNIPDHAFYDCGALTNLNSQSKIEVVGIGAFSKTSLSSFDFENIKSIGEGGFGFVPFSEMPELYLPDGFSDLGDGAFGGTYFSSVSLPISLLSIPLSAFQNPNRRFELKWRIPDDYNYEGNEYNIIGRGAFASALTNSEVIVPEGVDEILNLAFYNNNLKSITLPSTLKLLFANALQKGEGGTVETIYCHAKTPPTVDAYGILDTWLNNIFKCVIYVPDESLFRYKEDDFWGRYNIQAIPVEVESITLDAESIDLAPGETYQLTATIAPSDATETSLIWTSSDESVASVSESGLVYANNDGTAVITVSSSNGVAATCRVVVEKKIIEMEAIILNVEELSLEVGDSYQLVAEVMPSDATYQEVEWSTDNEAVANVDQNGLVTMIGEGNALIYVRSINWPNVEAICRINVTTDVKGLVADDALCDIYTITGKLLKKDVNVSEIDHLSSGIYLIFQSGNATQIIK